MHNLDKGGSAREVIDDGLPCETLQSVGEAGRNLRENRLGRLERWCGPCERCDHAGLCRTREHTGTVSAGDDKAVTWDDK